VDVVEALDRVLAPHGSMCVELGDTYAGSGGAGGDYNENGLREGQAKFSGSARKRQRLGLDENDRPTRAGRPTSEWPLPKSLTLIPETFRMTLVYGVNPHTGRTTEPWRLRNVIRWVRPNPPVGALGDKFRPATSELMVFCKSTKRWFDLDAVRDGDYSPRTTMGKVDSRDAARAEVGLSSGRPGKDNNPAGAPPLDWWNIPTHGYKGAHYATWPPALCVKPIKAMSPSRVCLVCGEPSRRIVDVDYTDGAVRGFTSDNGTGRGGHQGIPTAQRVVTDTRWSDCGHDNWRPGHVLDCFAGTGVVGAVATGLGRDATLIDLDARNVELARDRVGPLLFEVVDSTQ